MTYALVLVAILFLIGILLREHLAIFRWLYIPASVLAGLIGLAIVQGCMAAPEESHVLAFGTSITNTLGSWPGWLISVVFAGMLLEQGKSSTRESAKRVGQQGLMVWVLSLIHI